MNDNKLYSFKESGIKIWTPEGFKYIKNVYHIKKGYCPYRLEIDGGISVVVPDFLRIKTPRGYIKPSELVPENDAVVCHSDKNLNTLKTLINVTKENNSEIKEWIFIETENSPVVRSFPAEELEQVYSCLTESGVKTQKPLKEIKEGDSVQTGDEFKEVICKKMIDEDEGIIIINMNNNAVFINDVCVVPDIKFIRKEVK
jgi:hypothetical protein